MKCTLDAREYNSWLIENEPIILEAWDNSGPDKTSAENFTVRQLVIHVDFAIAVSWYKRIWFYWDLRATIGSTAP